MTEIKIKIKVYESECLEGDGEDGDKRERYFCCCYCLFI